MAHNQRILLQIRNNFNKGCKSGKARPKIGDFVLKIDTRVICIRHRWFRILHKEIRPFGDWREGAYQILITLI